MNQKVLEFLNSSSNLAILYECGSSLSTSSVSPLYVLDSSFNPPHIAHISLITGFVTSANPRIMLLLSVYNADKKIPNLPAISHRLNMMSLLAQFVAKLSPNGSILVALTRHAMFVDKALEIVNQLDAEPHFLVGFDTFARILDPKYYVPLSSLEALSPFFKVAKLLVLSRDGINLSYDEQESKVALIVKGEYTGVPAAWGQRIVFHAANGSTTMISSSMIRKKIANISDNWENFVIPLIRIYIELNRLYMRF